MTKNIYQTPSRPGMYIYRQQPVEGSLQRAYVPLHRIAAVILAPDARARVKAGKLNGLVTIGMRIAVDEITVRKPYMRDMRVGYDMYEPSRQELTGRVFGLPGVRDGEQVAISGIASLITDTGRIILIQDLGEQQKIRVTPPTPV